MIAGFYKAPLITEINDGQLPGVLRRTKLVRTEAAFFVTRFQL